MQLFFEAYWGDELVSRVWIIENGRYKVDRINKSPIKQMFAREYVTEAELCDVLKGRCWEEDRPDFQHILEVFGLTEFNPIELVKRTHGKSCNDPLYLRFADEFKSDYDNEVAMENDDKKIIKNRIKCNFCGDIIESTNRHEFVTCKCGSCSVDGGLDYLRRSFPNSKDDFTELSEFE